MLMEQDPVNLYSPWNSFNVGTALHSTENNLLNGNDIFAKKNVLHHAPSSVSSYRHSDSSSPMSWSEVDNSPTFTGSRLSGTYDNGYSHEISNLWNKVEKDTNSGNLGLEYLKELASKDLSPCHNLFDRDTNECDSSLKSIGTSCTTTSTYTSNLFGCFQSGQKSDNFLQLDPTQATTDSTSLLKDIFQHSDSHSVTDDSPYLSFLGAVNSYGLNELTTLELSLANTTNALTSSFNPLPTDPNAQKNFIENLKRLRDLNELTSELNLNPDLEQTASLYESDGQFSPKDHSLSQNFSGAGYDDIFYVGINGSFCSDKTISNCNNSKSPFEVGINESRNIFQENILSSRNDFDHNRMLLEKTESAFGPILFSESKYKGINAQKECNDKLLSTPLPKASNDLFMPNIKAQNSKENFDFKDNNKQFGLSVMQNCGPAMNTDLGKQYQHHLSFSGKDVNAPYLPPVTVIAANAEQRPHYTAGINIDNSFRTLPSYINVSPAHARGGAISRPLRPYPPPSVEFSPPRHGLNREVQQCLEDFSDQFRQLEYERKETEIKLCNTFTGRNISSSNSLPVPRLPPAPSRVDRLIIDNFREHSKVITLIRVMQDIMKIQFHSGIHRAVAFWHVTILQVQDKRNKEILSAFNCRGFQSVTKFDFDMHSLVVAIQTLAKACRSARTSLFCAFTLTMFNCTYHTSIIQPMDKVSFSEEVQDGDDPFDFIIKSRKILVADVAPEGESNCKFDVGKTAITIKSEVVKKNVNLDQVLTDKTSNDKYAVNLNSTGDLDPGE